MKNKVEAVLFTTGKYMSVEEIAKILNHKKDVIRKALEDLEKEYSSRDSAITLQKHEDQYKLNIKKEHGNISNRLLSGKEFDSPTTKTLAVIAYKSPAIQAEIIKIRGNKAYEHIKSLSDSGLVISEKQGRTRLLKLTENFYDYFDIAEKELKQKFEPTKKQELENTNIKEEPLLKEKKEETEESKDT